MRVPLAVMLGPPKGPAAFLVSATRHGVTGMNNKPMAALPVDAAPFSVASSALQREQGYQFRSPGVAAAEIGVRLMRPGRYQELQLSLGQARALGRQYVQALKKEYGHAAANRISSRIDEALR